VKLHLNSIKTNETDVEKECGNLKHTKITSYENLEKIETEQKEIFKNKG